MKKWISILLAAVLVLGMTPLPVQADGEITASGSCGAEGSNVTWTLDDSGLLTIRGTGAMWDFSGEHPGWYQDRDRILKCVIADGVTSIGQNAFDSCENLVSVVIGNGATVIKQGAFKDCESLASVAIPVSVTCIEDGAFSGCYSLTDFHYGGTASQKAEISIGWNNEYLTYANFHEESTGPSPDDSIPDPTPDLGTGCGMNETAVYKLLMDQKTYYPEGMPWTNDNSYRWNINNTTGYGCAAFAFLLSDTVFGYLPARMISEDITIDDLRVGDIVRMYNDSKSTVVLKVYEDYVILAEGSYNGMVHWGRIYTAEEVERDTTYVYTRYPEHSFENGVCTECGAQEQKDTPAAIHGDCNGDGKVNSLDLILLRQYLAGWDVELDLAGADVNGNGTANSLDLILLRQYLAGWDVTLGPNTP